jgi:flagellar assembly factor FliW
VNVVTHRFGPLEVPDEDVFVFPAGLPGFARLKKFTFVQHRPDTPFRWLQSMESPSVAFVVADPTLIVADYAPPLKPSDLAAVEARDGDDLVMLVVLNVKGVPLGLSANL